MKEITRKKRTYMLGENKEIIGKRFGAWTVLQEVDDGRPGKYYECQCDCGNIGVCQATMLRAKRSTRCTECKIVRSSLEPHKVLGERYFSWTIKSYAGMGKYGMRFISECACGRQSEHYYFDLKKGSSKMCRSCANKLRFTTHGKHNEKIYKVWASMLHRCNNKMANVYKYYGARGIKVCERWHKFENFLADMGIPDPGLTLDRTDNDGNYCKENCRWVTHQENCKNRGKYVRRKKSSPDKQTSLI